MNGVKCVLFTMTATMAFSGVFAGHSVACPVPTSLNLRARSAPVPATASIPGLARSVRPIVQTSNSGPAITGLWKADFFSGGAPFDSAFDIWHSDGTEVMNDIDAPSVGNVCLGVWEQVSDGVYKLKHPTWLFDLSGNLVGVGVIREQIQLATDHNSYQGKVTFDCYDNTGTQTCHVDGSVKAVRITVD